MPQSYTLILQKAVDCDAASAEFHCISIVGMVITTTTMIKRAKNGRLFNCSSTIVSSYHNSPPPPTSSASLLSTLSDCRLFAEGSVQMRYLTTIRSIYTIEITTAQLNQRQSFRAAVCLLFHYTTCL